MALIDKASLLMVPSTYEDGTLYNVLPSGNKAPDKTGNNNGYDQTRADFTFSRGSNLSATRIGSDGLIEKGRENLYTYSQQIDNAIWGKARGSVTANAIAAPDGTTTADLFTENTATGTHDIRQSLTSTSGKVYTFSIHAKSNGRPRLDVYVAGPNKTANFNLSTGSVIGGSAIDKKIESLGGGWYRCSVVVQAVSTATNAIWILNNGTTQNYTGDGTSGMYFWGVQAEEGLVATDYIETGATTAQAGILEDMPRINYDANGENGALLLEPSRTNSVPYSEGGFAYSTSTSGTGVTPVITENAALSPEGVQNAFKVVLNRGAGNTSGDWSWIYQNNVTYYNGDNRVSVYLKAATSSDIGKEVFIRVASDGQAVTLTEDWKRYDFNRPTSGVTSDAGLYTRGGSSADNEVSCFVYGFQVEQNASYPSSYIPTHGAAVTRGADSWYADNIGQTTAYTIFIDYDSLEQAESNFQDYISFQASGSTQDGLRAEGVGSDWRLYGYNISGSVTFPITGSINKKKKAIVVSTAGIKLFEDGALTTQDLRGMTIPALGAIVSKRGTSAPYPTEIKQAYKQIAVFNEALTDAECISLTS